MCKTSSKKTFMYLAKTFFTFTNNFLSLQFGWSKLFDRNRLIGLKFAIFYCKYLNRDIKNGVAELCFQFSVLKYLFKGLFIKGGINLNILLQNLGATPKSRVHSETLGAIPGPWEQPPHTRWNTKAVSGEHIKQTFNSLNAAYN